MQRLGEFEPTCVVHVSGPTRLLCEALAASLRPTFDATTELVVSNTSSTTVWIHEVSSLDSLKSLHKAHSHASIALVKEPKSELLKAILELGMAGILTVQAPLSELRECIRRTLRGDVYHDSHVQRCLAQAYIDDGRERLTTREQQVAILVARGWTSRRIADTLRLSMKTVSNHRRNIFRKLAIHDAVSLAHYAVRVGWISIDEAHPASNRRPRPDAMAVG